MPVAKLRSLLEPLDGKFNVVVNDIGNILIFSGAPGDEDNWEPVGCIEISSEEFAPYN
jgi:hypothetical protein